MDHKLQVHISMLSSHIRPRQTLIRTYLTNGYVGDFRLNPLGAVNVERINQLLDLEEPKPQDQALIVSSLLVLQGLPPWV